MCRPLIFDSLYLISKHGKVAMWVGDQGMYQYRVNQRERTIAANDSHGVASAIVFAPVDDIIEHCEAVSRKFATETRQMNLNRAPLLRAV